MTLFKLFLLLLCFVSYCAIAHSLIKTILIHVLYFCKLLNPLKPSLCLDESADGTASEYFDCLDWFCICCGLCCRWISCSVVTSMSRGLSNTSWSHVVQTMAITRTHRPSNFSMKSFHHTMQKSKECSFSS